MIDLSERAKTSECGCQTPLRQQLVLVRVEFTEENFLTCLTFFDSADGSLCGSNGTNISLGGLEPFSNLICSVFLLKQRMPSEIYICSCICICFFTQGHQQSQAKTHYRCSSWKGEQSSPLLQLFTFQFSTTTSFHFFIFRIFLP